MALNKKFFPKVSAAADTFTPSEHFNTVLYTGNGGTQRIGGYINRGAVFNGSSSTILTSSSFANLNTFSASAFVKFNTVSGTQTIASTDYKTGGGSGDTGWMFRLRSGNKLNLARVVSNTFTNIEVDWTPSVGVWYHLAATRTNTETKFYVDGTQQGTTQTGGTGSIDYTSDAAFTIGVYRYVNANYNVLNGVIDQVRFFNKEISSSEASTLASETHASTTISTTDIFNDNSGVALYQLDGNANDTGLVAAGTIVSSNKIIDLNVDSYTSGTTIDDSTSNNNDATIVGDVSYDNWLGRGRFDLQGSSDYLKIDASTTFNGATDLTLEGWFRPDNLTAVDHLFAIYNTSGSSNKLYLRLNDTDGDLDMHAYGSGSASIASLVTSNSNARVQANKWNHIVGVWESGTAMSVYINGVLAGTTASMGNLNTAGTEDLYIGVLKGYIGSYDFDGEVGEIRGYSSALTASEVLQNFNATRYYYAAYDGTASNINYQEATKFSPDLVWIKKRSSATNADHMIFDSVRGADKVIISNNTNAEYNGGGTGYQSSFDSNGFSITGNAFVNEASQTFVAWCFNAGTDTAASNTDGSITSTVKANQGFSIVKHTAPSSEQNYTIGHGLSQKPDMVILKGLDSTSGWFVWHKDLSQESYYLYLNGAFGESGLTQDTRIWGQQSFTDSVISTRSNYTTTTNEDYISYCFHSVDGIQKVGSYTGNGSANGTFVETGFEPAFLMIKNTTTAYRWYILDNKRDATNPNSARLFADSSAAEATNQATLNFFSNGFEVITSDAEVNKSGDTMIYLAIAADPDTTTPTVADSFDVVTYTGNDSSQDIETDFKPDLVWIKRRTSSEPHAIYDSIRGINKQLSSDSTGAEATNSSPYEGFTAFNDNGFTVGNNGGTNRAPNDYVAWCWKAGDHDDNLPQINTEGSSGGSTLESIVSVNDEAGFSIVKYTATGTAGATIGHGLSSAPELIIVKHLDGTSNYPVYVTGLSAASKYLYLNTSDAETSSSNPDEFHSTAPTSTVFSVGLSGNTNTSGGNYIAYCWYSVAGHSKIGTYTWTGTSYTAGTLVTGLGFTPRFVMIKRTNGTAFWQMYDNSRVSGTQSYALYANASDAESTSGYQGIIFDSDGFSAAAGADGNVTGTDGVNVNGGTYIYMAFK